MSFDVNTIYDKHLNLLIGSGASSGLLPTLALPVTDAAGSPHTIETLATLYQHHDDRARLTALFMHYFEHCVQPAQAMRYDLLRQDPAKAPILTQYRRFVESLLALLRRRRGIDKRCNLFTTNYDGCLADAANQLMLAGGHDFIVNDGGRGFFRRVVEARNYATYTARTGIYERHQQTVPQLNLIPVHGSVYWSRDRDQVLVDYSHPPIPNLALHDPGARAAALPFSQALTHGGPAAALPAVALTPAQMDQFWAAYNSLPIVNPTKWKFHETVFEEHYYQMLRMLSFELERENAVLITFGFSFADEHILNLVKRSLSNPQLMVFVTCFNAAEHERLSALFSSYPNVQCIQVLDGNLDFAAFNAMLTPTSEPPADAPVVGARP